MSDTDEIFDTGEPEIVEQKKKGRKPMSEERKQQLREQLKKARDAKKAKKSGGVLLTKKYMNNCDLFLGNQYILSQVIDVLNTTKLVVGSRRT